jgi:hypothetical protein
MATYLRPNDLPSALKALADSPALLPLAGGTDIYPAHADRPIEAGILDLNALPGLRRIEARGDHWRVPCLATWTDLLETRLPPAFDGLKQAAAQVGGPQVQNAGTIVGNLCNASPAADGIPCLLALDACVELSSSTGTRTVAVEAFVQGPRRTALRPGELATAILVPRALDHATATFRKLGGRRYLLISIAMVAAVTTRDARGRITEARIAVGACSPAALRLRALEARLTGTTGDIDPDMAAQLAPIDDIRATAAYRLHAAQVLVSRAVAA